MANENSNGLQKITIAEIASELKNIVERILSARDPDDIELAEFHRQAFELHDKAPEGPERLIATATTTLVAAASLRIVKDL